jgi:hypothetical protein
VVVKACFLFLEYNLGGLYANHRVAKVLLWRYFCLPLLPVNEIVPQMRRIKEMIRLKMKEKSDRDLMLNFHTNYMKKFWIMKIRPERFSVFGSLHKTNNSAESLHKVMRKIIPDRAGFFPWFQALHKMVIKKAEDDKTQIDAGEEVRAPIAPDKKKHEK